VSFDQADGTPFFPASYWGGGASSGTAAAASSTGSTSSGVGTCGMSVGLENGDLLFLACAGTRTVEEVGQSSRNMLTLALPPPNPQLPVF